MVNYGKCLNHRQLLGKGNTLINDFILIIYTMKSMGPKCELCGKPEPSAYGSHSKKFTLNCDLFFYRFVPKGVYTIIQQLISFKGFTTVDVNSENLDLFRKLNSFLMADF